jgi:hypothetical protein
LSVPPPNPEEAASAGTCGYSSEPSQWKGRVYNGARRDSLRRLSQREATLTVRQPRYSKEEFARRGDEIYNRDIRPLVEADNKGKFVTIDIETGAWEMDANELAACDRLIARIPDCQTWLVCIGRRYVHHIWESKQEPICLLESR